MRHPYEPRQLSDSAEVSRTARIVTVFILLLLVCMIGIRWMNPPAPTKNVPLNVQLDNAFRQAMGQRD